jgi:hypothetical protein
MIASTAIVSPSAADGHSSMSGYVSMSRKPSSIMAPQLGTLESPMPRNWSPACMPIAIPAVRAVWMMTGGYTAVITWRKMIRTSDRPETRAASM